MACPGNDVADLYGRMRGDWTFLTPVPQAERDRAARAFADAARKLKLKDKKSKKK